MISIFFTPSGKTGNMRGSFPQYTTAFPLYQSQNAPQSSLRRVLRLGSLRFVYGLLLGLGLLAGFDGAGEPEGTGEPVGAGDALPCSFPIIPSPSST